MSGAVFTIAASGSTSDAIKIDENQALTAIQFPAAMTGTAVDIHGSNDNVTFAPIYNDGVKLTVGFVASSWHQIAPAKTFGFRWLKVVSNGTEASAATIKGNATRII